MLRANRRVSNHTHPIRRVIGLLTRAASWAGLALSRRNQLYALVHAEGMGSGWLRKEGLLLDGKHQSRPNRTVGKAVDLLVLSSIAPKEFLA